MAFVVDMFISIHKISISFPLNSGLRVKKIYVWLHINDNSTSTSISVRCVGFWNSLIKISPELIFSSEWVSDNKITSCLANSNSIKSCFGVQYQEARSDQYSFCVHGIDQGLSQCSQFKVDTSAQEYGNDSYQYMLIYNKHYIVNDVISLDCIQQPPFC